MIIVPQKILDDIDALRLGCPNPDPESNEAICSAAERTMTFEKYDLIGIHIHVWHSGLGKKPWMFEIRRNGLLRGSFEGVDPSFDTREIAERQAFEVAESMTDGTYALRYTS